MDAFGFSIAVCMSSGLEPFYQRVVSVTAALQASQPPSTVHVLPPNHFEYLNVSLSAELPDNDPESPLGTQREKPKPWDDKRPLFMCLDHNHSVNVFPRF